MTNYNSGWVGKVLQSRLNRHSSVVITPQLIHWKNVFKNANKLYFKIRKGQHTSKPQEKRIQALDYTDLWARSPIHRVNLQMQLKLPQLRVSFKHCIILLFLYIIFILNFEFKWIKQIFPDFLIQTSSILNAGNKNNKQGRCLLSREEWKNYHESVFFRIYPPLNSYDS